MTAAARLCPSCNSDTDKALQRFRQEARANSWFTVRLQNGAVFAAKGDDELEISFDHTAGQIVATRTTTIGTASLATISAWITGQDGQQLEDLTENEVYGL